MNAALVKIDVAAHALKWNARRLMALKDGATLEDKVFVWIFNFASDASNPREDLRWWMREVEARCEAQARGYDHYEIEWVINKILPVKRATFAPDELDEMFQLRPHTRTRFHAEWAALALELKLCWAPKPTGNFYPRALLAAFLERRWLGAVYSRSAQNKSVSAAPHLASGHLLPKAEKDHLASRAAANKKTTHATP